MNDLQLLVVGGLSIFAVILTTFFAYVSYLIYKNLPKILSTSPTSNTPTPQPQAIHVYVNNTPSTYSPTAAPTPSLLLPEPEEKVPAVKTALQKLQERKERMQFDNPTLKKVETNFTVAGKKVISNA